MADGFTREHVKSLISTVRTDFLNPFSTREQLHLLQPNVNLVDSDPLSELQKLSQIIKAHSTKVGIVFNPSKFNDNVDAACNELQQFSNSVFFLVSLLPLFYKGKYPDYLIDELDSYVLGLFNGISGMCDEIEKLTQGEELEAVSNLAESPDADGVRLISVGKMWASCDSLSGLAKQGSFGLLDSKIRTSIKLLNDTLLEVEDWLLDPQLESDDPFGLDEVSEGESGDERAASDDMIEFVKQWQTNLKMIKLLLSSFSKSITSHEYKNTEKYASQLSKLNRMHKLVAEKVDELISTIFMLGADFDKEDEELCDITQALNSSLKSILQIIRTLNGTDPKRGKWVDVWEGKYFDSYSVRESLG
ncbi:LAFE_0C07932g1_1 [Lachancea fermentati]|uniref:LAFE_0C07932g1_1 n=1 Tax=Lachancea fermentati TaxID=4955 RepID=A0A1G4M9T8_LACFM|nr:LAFE_0C07932g1_1 [Lachancea fermentati]